ncbi:MAG: Crp/Fnr family transcriptional regulator [Hyphomicrobiaceae bacterium]|nr:Crp/Fnr family transcriptional regulator [Hyphomicrobiaceae bacterium]
MPSAARDELRRVAFWAEALTQEEAERARRGISERHYPAGSYICHRGDRLEQWTGVITGLVKIGAISASGKAITFAGIGSGGWLGEGSVLKDEPRKYDLVALRNTRLALMSRPTFMWLFEHSVGFNRFLVRQLNERMGQFIATIEHDRLHDPVARVARNIAWLCNPVLYPGVGNHIEITQEELALLVGVSRQVISRGLKALEEKELLRAERAGLTILDVDRLATYEGD